MTEARAVYINELNRWIIRVVADGIPLDGWREFGSRLPMGEKAFKREVQQRGGVLVRIMGLKQQGLAGLLTAELSAFSFETEAAAEAVLADLVHPVFLAMNMAGRS